MLTQPPPPPPDQIPYDPSCTFRTSFDRPNIRYSVQFKPTLANPYDTLKHILQKHLGAGPYPAPPGIKPPQPAPRGKTETAAASTMSMHSFLKPSQSGGAAGAASVAAASAGQPSGGGKGGAGKGGVRGSALVYCWKKADCETVARELSNRGGWCCCC
jgi:hypothetical protein